MKMAGIEDLQDVVAKRIPSFAGHILRLPVERPASTAMSWMPATGREQTSGVFMISKRGQICAGH